MGATGSGEINDATAIFDELLRYYDSKISALRQTRESLEDSKPVLTPPSTPRGGGESDSVNAIQKHPRNRAMLSLELLADMVDDMAMGIVFETVFEAKQSVGIYSLCNTRSAANSAGSTPSNALANYDSSSEQSADRKRKVGSSSSSGLARDVAGNRKKAKRK
ncbi:hypothetical protein GGI25_003065 [Coemansia spiralis]|uniref:Uncharacterized protein n=1 Tax=Coemansia spiralis TaxID=417178 RepID=A0A9W8G9A8_9FUNG|nr:hypothetical protein GGI25_003065 [Coemansia spiralis]